MPSTISGTITYTIPLRFKLEANFATADTHVYTSAEPPKSHRGLPHDDELFEPPAPNGYLVITSHSELDKFDSALENARYVRPRLLVLLGAITFLTDEPLTPLDIGGSSSHKEHAQPPTLVSNNKLISETGDHSKSLSHLLSAVTSTNPGTRLLVASLLDRWRKARWMQEEEETHLYADEAFLSYFHILELLAKEYDKDLTDQIKADIDSFVIRILEKTLKHRGPRLQQLKGERFKAVKLAVADHIPIASRICHFLENLGMLSLKSQGLVESLIDIRNSIAHGRQAYQDQLMWPLPSFFPLSKESLGHLPAIQILTARAISKHLKLDSWETEWRQVIRHLHPPEDVIRLFVKNKEHTQLNDDVFVSGRKGGIAPSAITDLYLARKIKFDEFEASLGGLMIRAQLSRKNADELIMAAYLLADSTNPQLASKAQEFVTKIHEGRMGARYRNPKDTLRWLEYIKLNPIWMRRWIENR